MHPGKGCLNCPCFKGVCDTASLLCFNNVCVEKPPMKVATTVRPHIVRVARWCVGALMHFSAHAANHHHQQHRSVRDFVRLDLPGVHAHRGVHVLSHDQALLQRQRRRLARTKAVLAEPQLVQRRRRLHRLAVLAMLDVPFAHHHCFVAVFVTMFARLRRSGRTLILAGAGVVTLLVCCCCICIACCVCKQCKNSKTKRGFKLHDLDDETEEGVSLIDAVEDRV